MSARFSYLDDAKLADIELELRSVNQRFSDRQLRVKFEAYDYLKSPVSAPNLKHEHKRVKLDPARTQAPRILVNLLNNIYSDYDFKSVNLAQFTEQSITKTREHVKHHLSQLCDVRSQQANCFMMSMWETIQRVLAGSDSTSVFSYVSEGETDIDADPLSNLGSLWSFNFFFLNDTMDRIVLLVCSLRQKKLSVALSSGEYDSSLTQFLDFGELILSEEDEEEFELADYSQRITA